MSGTIPLEAILSGDDAGLYDVATRAPGPPGRLTVGGWRWIGKRLSMMGEDGLSVDKCGRYAYCGRDMI